MSSNNEVDNTEACAALSQDKKLNCDEVALIRDAIERYLPRPPYDTWGYMHDVHICGLLYEIMSAANLYFEDDQAEYNATPKFLKHRRGTNNVASSSSR